MIEKYKLIVNHVKYKCHIYKNKLGGRDQSVFLVI